MLKSLAPASLTRLWRRVSFLCLAGFVGLTAVQAGAESAASLHVDTDSEAAIHAPLPEYLAAQARWKAELAAFDAADRRQMPSEGSVLFVGSSSVRMWSSLAQDFPEWPGVINRGFGGSTLHECRLLVNELVLRYKPRHVLVYAGDNDLNAGRTPRQVMDDFIALTLAVRSQLPGTRISFISIKPSPSRLRILPDVQLANAMIAAYLRTQTHMDYIDVFTPMLDAQGHPRADLFLKDALHLNESGYKLWHTVITAHFQQGHADLLPNHSDKPADSASTPAGATEPGVALPGAPLRSGAP